MRPDDILQVEFLEVRVYALVKRAEAVQPVAESADPSAGFLKVQVIGQIGQFG